MPQQFQLGSPREDQPYPIETELVKMMAQSPAGARIGSTYLGNYWQERLQNQNAYNSEVQAQNQFAYQQAANALAAEKQKQAIDLYGKPGGPEVIAGTPSLSTQLATDLSAPAIGDVANTQRNLDIGKTIEAVGRGAYPLVQAGLPPNAADIGSVIPQAGVTQGTPLVLQETAMKEAGANARAAASRGDPGITFHQDFGKDDQGRSLGGYSEKVQDRTGGVQGAAARAEKARQVSAQVVAGGDTTQQYGGAGSLTGSSAPASAAPASSVPPEVQANANNYVSNLGRSSNAQDRAKYMDIQNAMRGGGGNVPVYKRPDGSYGIQGKTGQY